MKKILIGMVVLFLAAFVVFSGCTTQESTTQTDDTQVQMEAVADDLTTSIDSGLNDVKSGIYNNSLALSENGLSGDAAEKTLSENLLNYPWAQSSLVISKEGVVVTAVPQNYADIIGDDLSWQSQVQTANTEQTPIVSDVFTMAEGFIGISQSYPVFSESDEYLGYTDITYSPETFLGRQILPIQEGTPYDVWVSQTDGTLIYDTKKEEIGNNLLSNPMYSDPVLQAVLTRIVTEPSGSDEYLFSDKNWNQNVTKKAVWETAGIDGAEWRVVVTYSDDASEGETTVVPTEGMDATDSRYEILTAFVESAAEYAQENGKEAALKEFNDVNGEFIDGELYIFAYENDETVISLPYQKELLGTSRLGVPDSNGVLFIDAATVVAKNGGGSLYYIYPNPKDDYKEEFKLSYVVPVDDEWFVGSGIYLPELPAEFSVTEKDELVQRVKAARDYAQETGRKKAVSDFNDLNQTFADGGSYIFAYDYEGNTLALPFQPEFIGINRFDYADTYGVKIIPLEISAAKNGGGFVYVEYLNPDTGDTGLKLCYVEPVSDEWFVGSGMYTQNL
ncbi:cache domain-containing protein [Methanogenium marinum]|uniref:Cache domain-containing protein n=1 Tax=Methanogenium marinum TaxID=348610 RepID=A0A9Q4KSB3_9EURY|nr:cache domain-containing protein [Methanogenium marinum]MDE4907729.1 cache domain-containing protein [Methanogenium marinum]